MAEDPRAAQVIARENDRIRALTTGDLKLLDEVLADDLSYIHTNGLFDGKKEIIDSIAHRLNYISVKREDLRVRFHGDVAIMTGALKLHVQPKAGGQPIHVNGYATQIWIDTPTGWKLTSSHGNIMPEK